MEFYVLKEKSLIVRNAKATVHVVAFCALIAVVGTARL